MAQVKLLFVLWTCSLSCFIISMFAKDHECINPVEYEQPTNNLGEKVLNIEVGLGNDAYFKVNVSVEGNHHSYIKFGRYKKAEMHPDPLLMRIGKVKVTHPYKLYDDSKLKYTGNLNDGNICIIMKNVNFNDRGAYAIYKAEEDGSGNDTKKLCSIIIELKVHNYSANHTTTLADASLTTGQSTIVNSTIISTINKLKNASLIPDHKNGSLTPDQENGKKLTEVKQHGLKILAVIGVFMLEIVFLIITQIIIEKIGRFRDVRHKKVVPSDCNNTSQAGHQDGCSEGTAVDETKSDINAEAREYQGESPINENKTEAQIEGTSDVEEPEDDEKDALMCDTGVNSVACKLSVSMLGKKCVTDDLSNVIGKSVSISTSNIDSQRDVSNSTIFKEGILDAVQ